MRTSWVLALALAPTACGDVQDIADGVPPNALWGSISESRSLEFDRVDIVIQSPLLRIEYIDEKQGGVDKVCKLIIDTAQASLQDGSELGSDDFDQWVILERLTVAGDDFPPVSDGRVHFDRYNLSASGRMVGDFWVMFDDGRNLLGRFDGVAAPL